MSRGRRSTSDGKLVGLWVVATALGSMLALLLSQALLIGLEPVVRATGDEVLVGSMLGLGLGIAQWLVLRPRLARPGSWIVASLLGGLALGLAADQAGSTAGSVAAFGAYGMILGVFQWLALRGKVRASGLWLPASSAAWLLGSQTMSWIDATAMKPSWPFGELVTVTILFGALGTIVGLITGILLAWLIQHIQGTTRQLTEVPA